eukprot:s6746_g3.t1
MAKVLFWPAWLSAHLDFPGFGAMACCVSGKSQTPLEVYAQSLPHDADAAPMLFPMYTVAADVLLKMTKVEPHEKLKAWGQLVDFSDGLGRAAFVSHHSGSISLDPATEAVVPTAKPSPVKDFQTKALFFWYDYFSCPQLHHARPVEDAVERTDSRILQADAITSIPAYVARCDFFLALCPVLDVPVESRVLTAATWSSRGWCRLE